MKTHFSSTLKPNAFIDPKFSLRTIFHHILLCLSFPNTPSPPFFKKAFEDKALKSLPKKEVNTWTKEAHTNKRRISMPSQFPQENTNQLLHDIDTFLSLTSLKQNVFPISPSYYKPFQ